MVKLALLIVSVVFFIALVAHVIIKRRNKMREQKAALFHSEVHKYLSGILSLAEQGNDNAKEEVKRIWTNYNVTLQRDFPDMRLKFCQMNSSIFDEKELEERLPRLRSLFTEYEKATDAEERLVLYTTFYRYWQGCSYTLKERLSAIASEMGSEAVGAVMISLLQAQMDQLAQLATSDQTAFHEMINLRQAIIRGYGEYHQFDGDIVFPSNWNDLVAQHIQNPHYTEFIGTNNPSDFPSGLTRRMAAEAQRTEDYTRAKIALSYCNCNKNVLAEVGSVLTSDLAKLVAKHETTMQASTDAES